MAAPSEAGQQQDFKSQEDEDALGDIFDVFSKKSLNQPNDSFIAKLADYLYRQVLNAIIINEGEKLAKERSMGTAFARNGFQVKLVEEPPRTSHYDALLNGTPAGMKVLKGHNNIVKDAKAAIRKKGAKIILLEFSEMTPIIRQELNKIKQAGIQGYYYTTKDKIVKPI